MNLYAMRSHLTGMIKIGRSKAPDGRLYDFMAAGDLLGLDMAIELLGYVPLANAANESAVHRCLSHARIRGEWFSGSDQRVLSFVESVIVEKQTPLCVWLAIAQIRQARADGIRPEPRLSLREFARQIQVSCAAVRKAIASQRLVKSIGTTIDGQPFIANVALARAEWNKSRRLLKTGQPE